MSPDKEWMTETEVAEWLQISPAKLRHDRWRKVGPPYVKYGTAVRYNVRQLEVWLRAQTFLDPEDRAMPLPTNSRKVLR